jgi:glucose/arabinose dehydrogenase
MPMQRTAGAAFLALSIAGEAPAAELEAVPLGTFTRPVHVAATPAAPHLLFVVEAAGRIRVLRGEKPVARPFLDIAEEVLGPPDSGAFGEEGLLSLAFPPDYRRSGLFYVAFTNRGGNLELKEFRRSKSSELKADPKSGRLVLEVPHPRSHNHNGAHLEFDADGLLYFSTGDGGFVEPRGENARDLDSLLGKILRIDPRRQSKGDYAIPKSNPFAKGGGRGEIFAYGLRNPWRFSLDGDLIAIADVGEVEREEIDILTLKEAAGGNFGWPQYEGGAVFDDDRPGKDPPLFPILDYGHSGGACAVIGGHIVRERALRSLRGRYLYGDFCTGELRSFAPRVKRQVARDDAPIGLALPQLSAISRGTDGETYLMQIGGTVSRLKE